MSYQSSFFNVPQPDEEDQIDHDLEKVVAYFRRFKDLEERAGQAIREAIDIVIAGRYTGRYSVEQLDKTEKTYIGTKVEQLILHAFDLPNLQRIDTRVDNVKVDVKFSIRSNWEIPTEAVGEICLVISANEAASSFQMGLIRTTADVLNNGRNQDGKRTISREGKKRIVWLVKPGTLPLNQLLHLTPSTRDLILAKPLGQQRVNEFFRRCQNIVVNGTTIEALAAQRDSSKRVRDARKALKRDGIVICSHFDNEMLQNLGYEPLKVGEFIALYQVGDSKQNEE